MFKLKEEEMIKGFEYLIKLNITIFISFLIYNIITYLILNKPFIFVFEEITHIGIVVFVNIVCIIIVKRRIIKNDLLSF